MPTTYTDLVPVRRVAVGDCAGPLGSGFDALARSAYTSLLAAPWTESSDPPMLPVHDNGQTANRAIPHGDAWKCTYGYDKSARTERSACGAVCYSYALPADATSGTAANISTVSLSLTGDRYLDLGVDLYIIPSASAEPPSIPDILALTPAGTYCATSGQSPTPPNQRAGVTAAVSATPGVAAQPYLHVALLLHDYVTNRGAWIEGGAMLDGGVTIAFSRSVAADTPPDVRILRVTQAMPSGGVANLATSVRLAVDYFYLDSPDVPPPFSDVSKIVQLASAGRSSFDVSRYIPIPTSSEEWAAYVYYDVSSGGGNYLSIGIAGVLYHAPGDGLLPGMQINVKYTAPTGPCTIALVQSSAEPAFDGTQKEIPLPQNPIVRLFDGTDADLVAISRSVVAASSGTSTATLTVREAPTKPYLALCIVPETIGETARYAQTPVLVASMPSNP